jgi:cytochrome c-type biogenesis protein CcmH
MKHLFGSKTVRLALYALLFAALMLATFTTAFAQDGVTDDEVNAIAKELYCPVCENTPLDVCPTEACRQWRELIRLQLSEGMTEAEIKQYFVENYGARVLAEPPRAGLNWLIYILPPMIILAGAFILFSSFREWTKPKSVETGADEERGEASLEEDDYVARLEEELKKRK